LKGGKKKEVPCPGGGPELIPKSDWKEDQKKREAQEKEKDAQRVKGYL